MAAGIAVDAPSSEDYSSAISSFLNHIAGQSRWIDGSSAMSRLTDQSEERQVDGGRSKRRRPDVTATEILENMSDGFMAFDGEWQITHVNCAAEQIHGMARRSLLGRNHWEAFPATVGTIVEREYRRAMADRVTVRFENFYEPYGRWFEMDACPIQNGGLAVYGRDVTERKRAEEQLAYHARLLEEARAAAERMIRDALRGRQVIEQTRRLARKSLAEKTAFDLNDAIREVLVLIGAAIRDHRVSVRESFAGDLPLVSGVRVQRVRRTGRAATLRRLLLDKARRPGSGAVDQSVDHCGPRRAIVGYCECGAGGDVPVRPSDGRLVLSSRRHSRRASARA